MVFCVTCYFIASSVLNVVASTEPSTAQVYSFVKRTADEHVRYKNWDSASRYYKQLAESDPLNPGAQISYAFGLTQQIGVFIKRIGQARSEEEKRELQNQLQPLLDEALLAYEDSLPFKQCRNYARMQLALLNGYRGEKELAKAYLAKAIEDGHDMRGIYTRLRYYRCEDIVEDPEVQRLLRR